ncbi:hypothetical protein B0T26DRAFT_644933 [Lasiosphaeria miniovina]|uniref:PAS domain-containing protein n=1 Tax=Lasiosphaeria miniovina TaxID=1954250 RepID=A0AA40ALZ7_9PEZI|nr:uncharacterized protein B0T26DRAFT_644933 [Lasiosphaeria miniovina]KAK0718167.1 hypothetical protein B0T26DRAFT_644933 [Lasiosphaeria miniovina]
MDPRDQTFMTIHNLTPEANILFASDSILDILGYHPDEVQGKSSFDYFHPDEVPLARSVHRRGVLLDKAAVLHYARILSRDGRWVSCECCFTIVHDVLVACTSIYLRGEKSERRALEAPQVRRIFSSSPLDPRYHMLEHLSPKFRMPSMEREPRAALILNRFTLNLSIMFATSSVASILGLQPDDIKDRPFYDCIQPNCLEDAQQCLESAKANESIAYLRFWFKDPRIRDTDDDDEEEEEDRGDHDADSEDDSDEDDSEDHVDGEDSSLASGSSATSSHSPNNHMDIDDESDLDGVSGPEVGASRSSSTRSNFNWVGASAGVPRSRAYQAPLTPDFELEAVVSCTSDGLVVVLRRARPPIPAPHPPLLPAFTFENGLFAAPWGLIPIEPSIAPELLYNFRSPFLPQYMPLRENVKAAGGPPLDQLMRSIRDVAVFAWAVVGINGNLADYGHGLPRGGAQPPDGLPIWDPTAGPTGYRGPENHAIAQTPEADEENMHAVTDFRPAERVGQSYVQLRRASLDDYAYASRQQPASTWPRLVAAPHDSGGYEPRQQQHATPTHSAPEYHARHIVDAPAPQEAGSTSSSRGSEYEGSPGRRVCGPQSRPPPHPSGPEAPYHNPRYLWQ